MKYMIFILFCFILCVHGSKKTCDHFVSRYAAWNTNLTMCTFKYSAPVEFCTYCRQMMKGLENSYAELLQSNDSKTNEKCSDIYFNKNRLNVIATVHQETLGMWEKAFCSDCFTNQSHTMKILIDEFNYCAENNMDLCHNCSDTYTKAFDMFKNLMKLHNGTVCFEIQDKMNRSEIFWLSKCGKTERKASLGGFAGLSTCLLFLQVLFYAGFAYFKDYIQKDGERLENDTDSGGNNTRQNDLEQPPPIESCAPKEVQIENLEDDDLPISENSEDQQPTAGGSLQISTENGDNFTEMHPYLKRETVEKVKITDLSESSDDEPLYN